MDIQNPSVAIVLVNWNGIELTRRCLKSLGKVSYPNFQVLIVDNGSKNEEGKILTEEYPVHQVIQLEKNIGFTGGNNAALNQVIQDDFDLVMLLNNDTEVESDFLGKLVDHLRSKDDTGAVQPLIISNPDRDRVWNAGGEINHLWMTANVLGKGTNPIDAEQNPYEIEWITGCCFLIRAEILKEIGLLDDRYFAYVEDVDWSLRIRGAGYKLYMVPASVIYHDAGGSITLKQREGSVNPIVHYLNIRNNIFLVKSHARGFFKLTSFSYQFFKLSGYIAYFLLRGRLKKLKYSLLGFYDGFASKKSLKL